VKSVVELVKSVVELVVKSVVELVVKSVVLVVVVVVVSLGAHSPSLPHVAIPSQHEASSWHQ
jgi:hypothetical protein